MSTRSSIALLDEDGTIKSVYCHFDGYPDGVGRTLKEHYTEESKIRKLLAHGDLSVLGAELGTKQDFYDRVKGTCLFYGRDGGETGIEAIVHKDIPSWLNDYQQCAYAYLFKDGEWIWFSRHFDDKPLNQSLHPFRDINVIWRDQIGRKVTEKLRQLCYKDGTN